MSNKENIHLTEIKHIDRRNEEINKHITTSAQPTTAQWGTRTTLLKNSQPMLKYKKISWD